jgi:hypothetical protein
LRIDVARDPMRDDLFAVRVHRSEHAVALGPF